MNAPSHLPKKAPPSRISERVIWLDARLNDRDLAVLATVELLGIASGGQLERLHFHGLRSSVRVRQRVLRRLVDFRALMVLPRRIGGQDAGSSAGAYALDPAAARLLRARHGLTEAPTVTAPGMRLLRHALAVSELYTRLIEAGRAGGLSVTDFRAEPAAWWPLPGGGVLRPDAYTELAPGGPAGHPAAWADHWWIEIDRATESVPAVRGRLRAYLDFAHSGHAGPGGVIPRVLVTAPTQARTRALKGAVRSLPDPAAQLFRIAVFDDAVTVMTAELHTPGKE